MSPRERGTAGRGAHSRRWRRSTPALVLILIGAVAGPVLFAAASALLWTASEQERLGQAYRLLQAHDERYPQMLMLTLDLAGDIIDCGYEPEILFGSAYMRPGDEWTTFEGYFDLLLWRSGELRERAEADRADYVSRDLSPFELAFLDQCIRRTVAAPLCASHLRRTLERAERHRLSPQPGAWIPRRRPERFASSSMA